MSQNGVCCRWCAKMAKGWRTRGDWAVDVGRNATLAHVSQLHNPYRLTPYPS